MDFNKIEKITLWCVFLGLSVYLTLRAIWTPILHDEAAIFFVNIQHGEWLPLLSDWEAGNHFLNSGLTIFFTKLFGTSLFTLRLASLISFPFFFWYGAKLATLFSNLSSRLIVYFGLFGSAYVIEFFGYSRGYGLQIAMLLPGLYFGLKSLRVPSFENIFLGYLFFGLSCFSIITTVVPFAVLLLAQSIYYLKKKIFNRVVVATMLVFGLLPLVCFGLLGKVMNNLGLFYKGDHVGFWETTVKSMLKAVFQSDGYVYQLILFALLIFVAVISFLRLKKISKGVFFPFMLFLSVAVSILVVWVFGANYLEDRTGFFLIPLLILAIASSVEILDSNKGLVLSLLISIPFILPFLLSLNVSGSQYWRKFHYPKEAYDLVKSDSPDWKTSVSSDGISRSPWAFYNHLDGGNYTELASLEEIEPSPDYVIIEKSLLTNADLLYDEIGFFPFSNLSVLKRKKQLNRIPIITIPLSVNVSKGVVIEELFSLNLNDSTESVLMEVELTINSENYTRLELEFNGYTPREDSIYMNIIKFNEYGMEQVDAKKIQSTIIIDVGHFNTRRITANLLNKYRDNCFMSGEIRVFSLE